MCEYPCEYEPIHCQAVSERRSDKRGNSRSITYFIQISRVLWAGKYRSSDLSIVPEDPQLKECM